MSRSESVVAVAYYEDVEGSQHSYELSRGEKFALDCDLVSFVAIEARPAEDADR